VQSIVLKAPYTLLPEHHLNLSVSGKYSAMQQLTCDDYLYTNIHHCLQPSSHSSEQQGFEHG